MPLLEGMRDFLNSSALYGVNILQKDIRSEEESVKLMTLHASKGLEFSHVFITGVNYGLIPLPSKDFEEEDEERRLFFVGITRAKDYLELSYYTNPDFYRVLPGESRYIHMIPAHLIQEDTPGKREVNLQELKRQVQKAKTEGAVENSANEEAEEQVTQEMVKHQKYGIGKILKEDDLMMEVEFENYGVKEFMKAFSELERV